MMRKLNNFSCFSVTFLFFTCLNFYFSNLIVQKLAHGWHFSNSLIHLISVKNTGAAFSLMQHSTNSLIILSVIAILAIFYYLTKSLNKIQMTEILFLSFLTSGIVGNLHERLFFGYVRDFFDLTFINFPIFNISDIFINIGVLGIIILILVEKKSIES